MVLLYSLIFILFGAWITFQERKGLGNLLGIATALALVGFLTKLYSQGYALESKMGIMAVSMIALAFFSSCFTIFKSKILRLGILAVALWNAPQILKIIALDELPQRDQLNKQGELLVKINPDKYAVISAELDEYQLIHRNAFDVMLVTKTELDDYLIVDIPDGLKLEEEIHHIEGIEGIRSIEYNSVYKDDKMPGVMPAKRAGNYMTNDPMRSQQWHMDRIKIDELFTYIQSSNVKPVRTAQLYVLDSGSDAKHPDLQMHHSQMGTQDDKFGHGTHCLGVAAATNNNGIGISSIIPNRDWVEIHSIKVLGDNGYGARAQAIQGIITAADQGADVISMSMGALSLFNARNVYNEAIDYAQSRGTIVVASAGNSNSDAEQYAPANANNSITVTAIDENNNKASFSNTVENTKYGIAAPGTNILSTIPNNKYEAQSGTSMAAPQVSATIALMKSIRPELNVERVHRILMETGTDTNDTALTGKMIYPAEAIKRCVQSRSNFTSNDNNYYDKK